MSNWQYAERPSMGQKKGQEQKDTASDEKISVEEQHHALVWVRNSPGRPGNVVRNNEDLAHLTHNESLKS